MHVAVILRSLAFPGQCFASILYIFTHVDYSYTCTNVEFSSINSYIVDHATGIFHASEVGNAMRTTIRHKSIKEELYLTYSKMYNTYNLSIRLSIKFDYGKEIKHFA